MTKPPVKSHDPEFKQCAVKLAVESDSQGPGRTRLRDQQEYALRLGSAVSRRIGPECSG
jgi:hypothetical protein